jgi:hypothetical protein
VVCEDSADEEQTRFVSRYSKTDEERRPGNSRRGGRELRLRERWLDHPGRPGAANQEEAAVESWLDHPGRPGAANQEEAAVESLP